jgi:hypothetical protein
MPVGRLFDSLTYLNRTSSCSQNEIAPLFLGCSVRAVSASQSDP